MAVPGHTHSCGEFEEEGVGFLGETWVLLLLTPLFFILTLSFIASFLLLPLFPFQVWGENVYLKA